MNYKDDIKAIVFDFDGTLIDFNYKASDYTRKALELLKDKDYKICLSTGRPCYIGLKAFKETFGEYPLSYIFGCNGSELMDVKNNKIDILHPLSPAQIQYLGNTIKSDSCVLGIYEEDKFLVNKEVTKQSLIDWMNARWLKPVLFDYSKNDIPRSKVLAISDPNDKEKTRQYMESIDLSDFNTFFSSEICFEIAPKGVSKKLSCETLAKILDIDLKQILSFGDNDNDLSMLQITTGVIMDNAQDRLKKLIPLHTDSVTDKGIYTFLKNNDLI